MQYLWKAFLNVIKAEVVQIQRPTAKYYLESEGPWNTQSKTMSPPNSSPQCFENPEEEEAEGMEGSMKRRPSKPAKLMDIWNHGHWGSLHRPARVLDRVLEPNGEVYTCLANTDTIFNW